MKLRVLPATIGPKYSSSSSVAKHKNPARGMIPMKLRVLPATIGPKYCSSSSVAKHKNPARGMIPMKLRVLLQSVQSIAQVLLLRNTKILPMG
ncbi:unnamed protein product [Ambrosiozyma monospora]|uniref:Unnamed protein product n=1 Tax=Ambrosiozyma monospora TaxID=43982 RepID=A0A9W6YYM6_AMBMO|nr:unnamed protein product [Ambrosiozyma monospora]